MEISGEVRQEMKILHFYILRYKKSIFTKLHQVRQKILWKISTKEVLEASA